MMPGSVPRAVTGRPANSPSSRLQQGIAAFQAGRDKDAQRLLAKVLAKAPATVDALLLMGLLAARQGRMAGAEAWLRRCVAAAPDHALAQDNLGNALMALGRPAEAEASHKQACRLAPRYAPAWYNLGNCLREQGKVTAAERAYRQALAISPDYTAASVNLGTLLREQEAYPEAERIFQQLLARDPGQHEVRLNLGNLYRLQGRFDAARVEYTTLLRAQPDHALALLSLALIAVHERDLATAQALLERVKAKGGAPMSEWHATLAAWHVCAGDSESALEELIAAKAQGALGPEYEDSLGDLLVELGRRGEAVEVWERSLARFGQRPPDLLGKIFHAQRHLCDWHYWDERLGELVRAIRQGQGGVISPFAALSTPGLLPQDLQAVARVHAEKHRHWMDQPPLSRCPVGSANPKIRVGYLSGDLREHATARLAASVFEMHDRDRFEVIAYSLAPMDDSAMSRRLLGAFDHLREVHALSVQAAARLIHDDQLDILVDVHGYTRLSRPAIPAQRPAPIQVSWLAFPGTMGASFMDYLIVDPQVVPPSEECYYDEALAYLPDCYQPIDARRESAPLPSRAEVGLPEGAFVYCCFNQPYKLSPPLFDLWCGLIRETPGAVLWLFAPDEPTRHNLRREAGQRGVQPERLVFAEHLPQAQHLARLALADLFLDSLPYNAHTTASDALWAHLPVLTCRGQTFASRVAASLLTTVGLDDLIVDNLEDYRQLALQLAREPGRLADYRQGLARARAQSPLFDSQRYTRNLEALYQRMVARSQAGQGPSMLLPATP